jgi:O-antigen/teichoic acid export membrane protein
MPKLFRRLKEGFSIFLSLLFTRINNFGSLIILGLLLSEVELGQYASALKLVMVGQSFLLMPIGGAVFPHLAALYSKDIQAYREQFISFLRIMLFIGFAAALFLFLLPDFVLRLVFGAQYIVAAPFLRIMSPVLFSSVLGYFSLNQGLVILKKDNLYLLLIVIFGLMSVALNFWLIPIKGIYASSWIKVGTDFSLALTGLYFFKRTCKRATKN